MKRFLETTIALIFLGSICWTSAAQESITIGYNYEGSRNLGSIRPSLHFAEFSDSRSVDDMALVAPGYVAEAALAGIVRDAFIQAFTAGDAEIDNADADMIIAGEITDSSLQVVDRDGTSSYQLTIRTRIELQGRGRTLYDTSLFGRGVAPVSEGLAAAVHASLDRMIRDLTRDDYFMIELQ